MTANIWTELLVDYSAVADMCGVHVEIHILLFAVLHSRLFSSISFTQLFRVQNNPNGKLAKLLTNT
jgi:hypothetical protein